MARYGRVQKRGYEDLNISSKYKSVEPTIEMFGLTQEKLNIVQTTYTQYLKDLKTPVPPGNRYMRVMMPLSFFAVFGYFIDQYLHSKLDMPEGTFLEIGFFIILILLVWQVYSYRKEKKRPKFQYANELECYTQFQKASQEYMWWQNRLEEVYWQRLSGRQFEIELAKLYQNLGYNTTICRQGGDEGIDIVLEKDGKKIAVQCKAHKKPISPSVARDLAGTMIHHGFEYGIIASTNRFTEGTIKFCKYKNIELISIKEILKLYNELKRK